MKQFVAASVGALVLGGGLVATVGTPAQADPYPGTFATTVTVSTPGKVKRTKRTTVCASVGVVGGNGIPSGTVTITVERNAGKYSQSLAFPYSGGQACLKTNKLKKIGGYTVRAAFSSPPKSVYSDSSNSNGFDVVKPKKKGR